MKLGVVVDIKWTFISELLADWQAHYSTDTYSYKPIELPFAQERVNRWLLKQSLQRFLKRNGVVFFEWVGPSLIMASRLKSTARIVTRLHSYELYDYAPHVEWRSVDRIILVSHAMQQRFNELYPEHAAKTTVVYHGKALDQFRPVSRQFGGQIGMLGNLTPIKRVYEMILMIYALRQKGYDVHLNFAGEPRDGALDQRYYASMKRAVEKLGLQQQVTFHGYVSTPDKWLQDLDIFISNSYWEGQQNALIEAMATGCYCLSHFWDGADEMLPAENLYSTESDLLEKLIAYYEMPAEQKHRHRSHMRVLAEKKFDLETAKKEMRTVIEEVYFDRN